MFCVEAIGPLKRRVIRELEESGQIGFTKSKVKTLTFDGDIAGKETFSGELLFVPGIYVKISDSAIFADELQSIIGTAIGDKAVCNSIPMDTVTWDVEAGATIFQIANWPAPAILAFPTDMVLDESHTVTAGTYVLYMDTWLTYVSAITCGTETVRPIDPKFLPGIDALTLNGADGKQYKLVVDASGALAVTPIE